MKKTKNTYVVIGSIIIILGVALIYVFGARPIKIESLDEGLKISGRYGETYAYEDIDQIQLLTSVFEITDRVDGSSIGSILRGHFTTTEYGDVMLFVHADITTYIKISVDDEIIIFNLASLEETETFYQTLLTKIPV